MNDADIKKDRSPNYPKATLAEAIELVKRLHSKAGKAQIKPEVAAGALGYSGMNGSALTALGILNQYGLVDRQRGSGMAVSPLAIKLIHPLNIEQFQQSKREAALKPRVFSEIQTGGLGECSEDVLCNHLIQNGFTPDGAKKSAFVFKQNSEFAILSGGDTVNESEGDQNSLEENLPAGISGLLMPPTSTTQKPTLGNNELPIKAAPQGARPSGTKVLAQYSISLPPTETVNIAFLGEHLSGEHFDALKEYVDLFKKQFERKAASSSSSPSSGAI